MISANIAPPILKRGGEKGVQYIFDILKTFINFSRESCLKNEAFWINCRWGENQANAASMVPEPCEQLQVLQPLHGHYAVPGEVKHCAIS